MACVPRLYLLIVSSIVLVGGGLLVWGGPAQAQRPGGLGVAGAVVPPISITASPTPSCPSAWTTYPNPAPPGESTLHALTALSPTNLWAVGNYGSGPEHTLILHGDGTTWTQVPSPDPVANVVILEGVAGVAANDVWAVGYANGNTLTEHWDGTAWSIIPSPNGGGAYNRLYAVAAIASNDVWAVGTYEYGFWQTLTEHWNGSTWTVVPSPGTGPGTYHLYGVAAVAANDVWAVGKANSGPLTLHWDGSQWTVVSSPNPGANSVLNGVAAVAPNDVWAVGSTQIGQETLIEHWDGSAWAIVPSPSPGATTNHLYAVSAQGATNVWAVGDTDQASGGTKTLAEHWDGSTWTVVPIPDNPTGGDHFYGVTTGGGVVWAVGTSGCTSSCTQNTLIARYGPLCATPTPTPLPCGLAWRVTLSPNVRGGKLTGVAGVAANDVWAVGFYYPTTTAQALIEHWDGSSWTVVPSPTSGNYSFLNGVTAVAANDIWAVGLTDSQALIEHWDGSTWSVVPSPASGTLNGVAAVAANDVWAVGDIGGNQTLIEHWNGSTWSVVPSPNPASNNYLNGVAVVTATDVWAVGRAINANELTLIEHWNGSQWTVVPSPSVGTSYNELKGAAAVAANDVWAVGEAQATNGYFQTLTEHWDGSTWNIVPSPNLGGSGNLNGVAAVAANDVWAVGDTGGQTVIAHWNGSQWSILPSPAGSLHGVAAVAPNNLWAVGSRNNGTLIEHYQDPCGAMTATPTGTPTRTPTSTSTRTIPPLPSGTLPPSSTVAPSGTVPPILTSTPCPIQFSDVPSSSPFYVYIRCLACRGIVDGYGSTPPCPTGMPCFQPAANVTRGQAAKFVANAAGYQDIIPSTQQTFSDVPPSSPFWLYVERAAAHGVVSGYSGSPPCPTGAPCFLPNNRVTRGQTSKFVSNAASYQDIISSTQQTFSDVPLSSPFWLYVERAVVHGVISGYSSSPPCTTGAPCFLPANTVTRAQTAKFIANAFFPGCQTP